jgi:glycosyltransferase involved in cell wall biosynthesis
VNIAILNWRDLTHPRAGGAEVFVHEVAMRWASLGHQVTLVCSHPRGQPRTDRTDGIDVVRIGRISTGGHHLLAPGFIRRTPRTDVVLESINTMPYWLPRRKGSIPTATLVHQMAVDVWNSHLPVGIASLARRAERAAFQPYRRTPVLAVSASTAADLRASGLTAVEVIPQGGIGPQKTYAKEKTPTVIFVGRLAANKRPDHAVEAFALMKKLFPDAQMWIVGEGPMRAPLSRRLPDGARLLGRLARSELWERMSRAHVLISTSVREGWGLVVTEANALGTPAVAYGVPGLKDAIRDGRTGKLVAPDPQSLADATGDLLQNPRLYQSLRQEAIRWSGQFTWDRTAGKLLEVLHRVMAADSAGHSRTA